MALIPLNPPAPRILARRAAWTAPAPLKFWHLASLDAPTVAVAWAAAFAWEAHVHLPVWRAALLGVIVWAIYVIDRLLDARTGLTEPGRHPLQERHWFHWRHRRLLAVLALIATAAAAWMVESRLSAAGFRRDSLIGLAMLAYFSGVHGPGSRAPWLSRCKAQAARLVPRELLVGAIFSAGCLLPALPAAPAGMARILAQLAIPAVAFAALAWLNVRAIGCWESWAARRADEPLISTLSIGLAAVCAAAGLALSRAEPRLALLLMAAASSALALAALDRARDRIDAVTLRAAADLVLLTPLALIPLQLLAQLQFLARLELLAR